MQNRHQVPAQRGCHRQTKWRASLHCCWIDTGFRVTWWFCRSCPSRRRGGCPYRPRRCGPSTVTRPRRKDDAATMERSANADSSCTCKTHRNSLNIQHKPSNVSISKEYANETDIKCGKMKEALASKGSDVYAGYPAEFFNWCRLWLGRNFFQNESYYGDQLVICGHLNVQRQTVNVLHGTYGSFERISWRRIVIRY